MGYQEDQKAAAFEVEALRKLWESTIGLDVDDDTMNFRRIHRSFGYSICADAIERAGRKFVRSPEMTPLEICRYTSGTARNLAIAAAGGVVVNYKPVMETRSRQAQ